MTFKNIAVIGAGTMGSGIAGQIANAGHNVLLLDLSEKATDYALERLKKSDPPALHSKEALGRIATGTIDGDFDKLAECDWIVEAIVERLDLKRDLYARLEATVNDECLVTSNTSTIPISLLTEGRSQSFQERFAITHYFNPVRYMRLLELVRGEHTRPDVMTRLAEYNDEVLGKGVVPCADTPGFLGNRVGVFALQVGLDETFKQGLTIEEADALMGRPMGIPKTGVFGLYDLIGVDLMSDVVDTLGDILPDGDPFHAVGRSNNPAKPMIDTMIAEGFTGEKSGKGGFYREDQAMNLDGSLRARETVLPAKAQFAADQLARNAETLTDLIKGDDAQTRFTRNYLGRVLNYAASLIPDVTDTPQDIDDAMKMGFNWIRGPFEMIDALGAETVAELAAEAGAEVAPVLRDASPFYRPGATLEVRTTAGYKPVALPPGTQRFSLTRKTLTPMATNNAASLWDLNGIRLVEFHSKANALTGESMAIVHAAADDPGRGIMIHNDAQHYSAGVDLNRFAAFIEAGDWNGMDAFLDDFQQAVLKLKYCPVPVVGASSGLALGGGFEVLLHCDALVTHANSVLGLVEAGVGLVPGGGGVKETMGRWAKGNTPEDAAWNAWMQVGYGKTGASPEEATKLRYYLPERDRSVMNRDKLITEATAFIDELAQGYTAPPEPHFLLPGKAILEKMDSFMSDGVAKGWFTPHNKTTAMEIATIVVNTETDDPLEQSEQDLLDRERAAFLRLAKTPQSKERIDGVLSGVEVNN
ncbi:MAG: 3-hydroxyacyl-CoA dehydrogenase NAD-binding domain-containing protein [Rhodobacteraceae bacterium]|nr:3-hydroxyacyl-CoA dehydrogenase NAD-binding domain-containing protein [Paracoccaceae bacterium]